MEERNVPADETCKHCWAYYEPPVCINNLYFSTCFLSHIWRLVSTLQLEILLILFFSSLHLFSLIEEHQTCTPALPCTRCSSRTRPKHNSNTVWAWANAKLHDNKKINQTPSRSRGEWWVLLFLVTGYCYCLCCYQHEGNNTKRANKRPSLYRKKQWSRASLTTIAVFTYLSDNHTVYSFSLSTKWHPITEEIFWEYVTIEETINCNL